MSRCPICRFTDGGNVNIDSVNQYIVENISEVGLDEMVQQVVELLESCHPMTSDEVKEHILEHITDQRVVLRNLLRDLVSISKVVKSSSVSTCEETGCTVIDPKTLSGYLKTVETITKIYSMENHRNAAKRE